MKFKYYLRGLGIGILFCALIATIAYNGEKNSLSDEEVIKRAEKLGMVMADADAEKSEETTEATVTTATTEVAKENDTDEATTEKTTEVTITEATTKETTEVTTTEATTKETTEVTTTEATIKETTEVTTETTTEEKKEEKTTEKSKEDKNEDKKDSSYVKATITVTAGMDSSEVAKLLQDAGIVKDYLDFDNYLNQNGYSTQIRIKSCEFNNKMTYEEIAKLLVKEE